MFLISKLAVLVEFYVNQRFKIMVSSASQVCDIWKCCHVKATEFYPSFPGLLAFVIEIGENTSSCHIWKVE
jgi:hypothetical protein